jgi:hypothetical protein
VGDFEALNMRLPYLQGYVADQRRDPDSLLNWTERRIRARKELSEIG